MREFKGNLITHNLPDHERLVEQKRLKHYLRGNVGFAYKGNLYPVDPYYNDGAQEFNKDKESLDNILPEINI